MQSLMSLCYCSFCWCVLQIVSFKSTGNYFSCQKPVLISLDKIWTLMWTHPGRVGGDEFECEKRSLLAAFFQCMASCWTMSCIK